MKPEKEAEIVNEDDESTVFLAGMRNEESADGSLVGSTFEDHYEVESLVGTGGMSTVYLARHKFMQKRKVAIKLLHSHLARNHQQARRFRLEAETAATLSHPGIVGVVDFGVLSEGQPYLIMDFVEGEPLSQFAKTCLSESLQDVLSVFSQICSALSYAHRAGIVHRDLKPSNIMIQKNDDGSPQVKIVDFGIAKLMNKEGAGSELTQTGEIFGSPSYMSPEQCEGRSVDERSDVYSLGCVMYEVLSGAPPFSGGTAHETIYKQIYDTPPPLRIKFSVPPDKARMLEIVVLKCLAKEKDFRPQTMDELSCDLKEVENSRTGGLATWGASVWSVFQARQGTRRSSLLLSPSVISIMTFVALLLSAVIFGCARSIDVIPDRIVWYKVGCQQLVELSALGQRLVEGSSRDLPVFSEVPVEERLEGFRELTEPVRQSLKRFDTVAAHLPDSSKEINALTAEMDEILTLGEVVTEKTRPTIFSLFSVRKDYDLYNKRIRDVILRAAELRTRWQERSLQIYSDAMGSMQVLWTLLTAGVVIEVLLVLLFLARLQVVRGKKVRIQPRL